MIHANVRNTIERLRRNQKGERKLKNRSLPPSTGHVVNSIDFDRKMDCDTVQRLQKKLWLRRLLNNRNARAYRSIIGLILTNPLVTQLFAQLFNQLTLKSRSTHRGPIINVQNFNALVQTKSKHVTWPLSNIFSLFFSLNYKMSLFLSLSLSPFCPLFPLNRNNSIICC